MCAWSAITIDSTDDSVHATNITVTGGTVTAATGDDGMHADNKLDIQAGTVTITKSYEGLEAAPSLFIKWNRKEQEGDRVQEEKHSKHIPTD